MLLKLSIIPFLLVAISCWSQDVIKVSGRVVDAQTKEALPFSTISIKGKPIGTVTNGEGAFDFYIPITYGSDTLMVSILGYSPYLTAVQLAAGKSHISVELVSKPLVLKEVIVNSSESDPNIILRKALGKIGDNYPVDPYVYRGFSRELWSQNDKVVSLVESVFDINDPGYERERNKSSRVREKVDLKNVRASEDYMNKIIKPVMRTYNSLTAALRWNPVKYSIPNADGDLTAGECTLDDVLYLNDNQIFVVSYITHSKGSPNFERRDRFYIDSKTFAITKCESKEYAKEGLYRNVPWAFQGADSLYMYGAKDVTTVYEFEPYQGKYYLKYYHQTGFADIFNKHTKKVEYEINGESLLVITEIVNRKGVKNTMNYGKSLILQRTPYDELFWNNNNEVKLVPLTSKETRDLEHEAPLSTQFKKF
ncbi:MAG TPA: carboxypeptidase-like regulatory domain-containing protein [Cyclobacteriaceae bacterium]|nr:carboxypeptidase-like regulatory domain-containing protein [Cyclobacteriaceae bacterium]